MAQKNPQVTTDLPPGLHKQFRLKVINEDLTVKAVVRQLIESWVKGDITLPHKPNKSKPGKKPRLSK